jgi:hypothetical protein
MKYERELLNDDALQCALQRIPYQKRSCWNEYVRDIYKTREPSLIDLEIWLKDQVEADFSPYAVPVRPQQGNPNISPPPQQFCAHTTARLSVDNRKNASVKYQCIACSGTHTLSKCAEYASLALEGKYNFVRLKKLCFNCLHPKHSVAKCSSVHSCKVRGCGKRHHTSLHRTRSHPAFSAPRTRCPVFFQVLPVSVSAPNGHCINTFALLDSSSDISLVTDDLAGELGLTGRQERLSVNTLSSPASFNSTCVSFTVKACDDQYAEPLLIKEAWTKDGSFNCHPFHFSSINHLGHIKDLNLSDVETHQVKILIGADIPKAHIQLDVREGQMDEPLAVRTPLGWTAMGAMPSIY